MKSYRSYKFPFVGLPALPPDVHSQTEGIVSSDTSTVVYVSWNGATEVATWNLYKTNVRGETDNVEPVASLPRSGFETSLKMDGYATYVVLEALDKAGKVLGKSNVAKTAIRSPLAEEVLAKETKWLEKFDEIPGLSWVSKGTYFVAIAAGTFAIAMVIRRFYRMRRKGMLSKHHGGPAYELVANQNFNSFAIEDDDNVAK